MLWRSKLPRQQWRLFCTHFVGLTPCWPQFRTYWLSSGLNKFNYKSVPTRMKVSATGDGMDRIKISADLLHQRACSITFACIGRNRIKSLRHDLIAQTLGFLCPRGSSNGCFTRSESQPEHFQRKSSLFTFWPVTRTASSFSRLPWFCERIFSPHCTVRGVEGPKECLIFTIDARHFAPDQRTNSELGTSLLGLSPMLQCIRLYVQGVSQITLQTQNAISPDIMHVSPQKFHCITGRS